jgi:thioredoxin reductase
MRSGTWDVIIVGAGPAGLSAALILGRCLRRVLICDAGQPRNAAAREIHGFLTRDPIPPAELLRLGLEQLDRYDTVELARVSVIDAARVAQGFEVRLSGGRRARARKLLVATGVVDEVPEIEGLQALYGRSVFHCPYCDGWEVRNEPLAIYGQGKNGLGLALELTAWSKDLVLCTNGPPKLSSDNMKRLARHGISVRAEPIARLEGVKGTLERVVFKTGAALPRRALFFSTGQRQHSNLPAKLGCHFTHKGAIRTGKYEATNIPGLYVAGDASRAAQLTIIAAAEGAGAAFAINTALLAEDLE